MLKLSFHWLLSCSLLVLAAGAAQAQMPVYSNGESAWIHEALAAGWQPPADWPAAETVPVSLNVEQVSYAAYSGCGCDTSCGCGGCCCECVGSWVDNTQVWFGGEVYKGFGDTTIPPGTVSGYMNSFGLVAGFNTGFALGSSRVRGQIGMSYGGYDFEGRDSRQESSLEQQIYFTAGLYKRSNVCCGDRISWGIVYDQFITQQWGVGAADFSVGQVRGIAGYALSTCNEVGVWGTAHVSENTINNHIPVTIRATDQANLFWRHQYAFGATSMLYAGLFDPANSLDWQVGFLADAPLNHCLSLYTGINLSLPDSGPGIYGSNELQWSAAVGLSYSLGGKARARSVSGYAGLPLLPVANNGSFLITD